MEINKLYDIYKKSNSIQIDNRKINKNDIFFGLTGGNNNGAIYAQQAIENGAIAAIIDDKKYENIPQNIFYVKDALSCLQELAIYHRNQLKIPIISITGSNGKTTTKELINSVLSQKFPVQYTQGNLNNHIGVPLTILSINPEIHNIGIVEMGANHQKEIEFLCSIAKPDIGYITNFGKSHLEGFGGVEGVIKGKTELYKYLIDNNKSIIINTNDSIQLEYSKSCDNIIYFGEKSDYYFEPIIKDQKIGLKFKNQEILSNLTGDYNFTNLSVAVRLGIYFDISIEEISKGIKNYTPNNHRSQIIEKNNHKIIMDAYNANPTSMEAAIKNFKNFEGTKTVILGDMFELGQESKNEHEKIFNFVIEQNFEQNYFIGEQFYNFKNNKSNNFKTREEFINFIQGNPIENINILVKGSRGMQLEKVLEFL